LSPYVPRPTVLSNNGTPPWLELRCFCTSAQVAPDTSWPCDLSFLFQRDTRSTKSGPFSWSCLVLLAFVGRGADRGPFSDSLTFCTRRFWIVRRRRDCVRPVANVNGGVGALPSRGRVAPCSASCEGARLRTSVSLFHTFLSLLRSTR